MSEVSTKGDDNAHDNTEHEVSEIEWNKLETSPNRNKFPRNLQTTNNDQAGLVQKYFDRS